MKERRILNADRIVLAVANFFNISMVIIFLSRVKGVSHPHIVGWLWVMLIFVLTIAVIVNIKVKREKWEIVLPFIFISFLILEVILDYLLNINFRDTWLLGPYLLLYYLSILGMIGYAFRIGKQQGVVTLVTYFLSQIAAIYSYIMVGHG